ncbi:hypothetical protein [Actinoplanes philippinensis]|uniref:hypothetical protein n=1 Tax=Actinoplanes philippinensis TaxID=35752 RepID=UPI0033C5A91B
MRRAAAVLAVLLPVVPAAAAPTTVNWTVQPATAAGPDGRRWIEHTLEPGGQVTEHLAVRNLGDTSAVFTLSAADGCLTAKGRFNMLPSDRPSAGGGTWVSVPGTVTVGAGRTVVVPFSITAPAGVTPGDHPAGIAASIAGSRGTVQVESRVGFRLMLRAAGMLRPSVTADRITLGYARTWNPFQPGTVRVTYTGDEHRERPPRRARNRRGVRPAARAGPAPAPPPPADAAGPGPRGGPPVGNRLTQWITLRT